MAIVLDTNAYLDTVCELLRQGQRHVAIPVTGGSMVPKAEMEKYYNN